MADRPESNPGLSAEARNQIEFVVNSSIAALKQDCLRRGSVEAIYQKGFGTLPRRLLGPLMAIRNSDYLYENGSLHPYCRYPEVGITVGCNLAVRMLPASQYEQFLGELESEFNGYLNSDKRWDYPDWIRHRGDATAARLIDFLPHELRYYPEGEMSYRVDERQLYLSGLGLMYGKAERLLIESWMPKSQFVASGQEDYKRGIEAISADLARLAGGELEISAADFERQEPTEI